MKKNFKKLPKNDINTKDLMNTYRILENINKLNTKKFDVSPKKEDPLEPLELNEDKTLNQSALFFNNFYNENDYEEKMEYECVFNGCGKSFANSEVWKKHHEMHV